MYDMREIERMTIHEYTLRMTAYKLSALDKQSEIHMLAWKMREVQAEKVQGKKSVPVFKKYDKFFDFDKQEREILGVDKKSKIDSKTIDMFLRANS